MRSMKFRDKIEKANEMDVKFDISHLNGKFHSNRKQAPIQYIKQRYTNRQKVKRVAFLSDDVVQYLFPRSFMICWNGMLQPHPLQACALKRQFFKWSVKFFL